MEEAPSPSLVFLCIESLKIQLLQEEYPMQEVYELPSELIYGVVAQLPALALQNLQTHMPFNCWEDYESGDDYLINGKKRGRNDMFRSSWKALFKLRWPELIDSVEPLADWQQLYWEKHMQNCVDEAAELALRPTFSGQISSINVSGNILRYICHEEHMDSTKCVCRELSFHFRMFGPYLRCLRLLNVLCVRETCELLRRSKLQTLVLRWIRSEEHVLPLCELLIQNRETLTSLEFIHCKLSSSIISAICGSLHEKSIHTKGMKHFCIKTSSIEIDPLSAPSAFISFLKSVRSLHFCDSHLDGPIARMVFLTLLESSSDLSSLDLSENNISGWLFPFNWRSVADSLSSGKSLRLLCTLNLRGNELDKYDAENLACALLLMPSLESLNLSGNPIEDSGIRSLISYFTKSPNSRLTDLDLENCELSSHGVIELLDTLSTVERPLKSLSVADNFLGSEVVDSIVNSFAIPIESLNISGVGLGPVGFFELSRKLVKESKKLLNINISKNRGGLATVTFMSKLIPLAPKLISIDASYNLMPIESVLMLCECLRTAKGDLKRIDMTGNSCTGQDTDRSSLLNEFQHNGKPILVLPSAPVSHVPYDDEP